MELILKLRTTCLAWSQFSILLLHSSPPCSWDLWCCTVQYIRIINAVSIWWPGVQESRNKSQIANLLFQVNTFRNGWTPIFLPCLHLNSVCSSSLLLNFGKLEENQLFPGSLMIRSSRTGVISTLVGHCSKTPIDLFHGTLLGYYRPVLRIIYIVHSIATFCSFYLLIKNYTSSISSSKWLWAVLKHDVPRKV